MAQLRVRDIPEETVAALEERAKRHGRSVEAEHRAILEEVLKSGASDFWEQADRIRRSLAESGRKFSDSSNLLRQDRDGR